MNDMLKFKRTDGVEDALKAIASQFITEEGTKPTIFYKSYQIYQKHGHLGFRR